MTGNAVEEGLMQQINNPSHLDRGRIAVPAGVIAAGGVVYLLPGPLWMRVVIGVAIGGALCWRILRYFERRELDRESERRKAERQSRMARTRKQIAAGGPAGKSGPIALGGETRDKRDCQGRSGTQGPSICCGGKETRKKCWKSKG